MRFRDIAWLWKASKRICEAHGLRAIKRRLVFMARALRVSPALERFFQACEDSPLKELLRQRPETVGAVVWPYQCLSWDAATRLERIGDHYEIIKNIPEINLSVDATLELLDLGDMSERLRVIVDRPKWFLREGQLVINLFLDRVRIFSLAFSLGYEDGKVVAIVGAIQGGNSDGVMEDYRNLTKTLNMRPRDFIIEVFRTFCRQIGVVKILAVSEAGRHHHSNYFAQGGSAGIPLNYDSLNYDEVWLERGGIPKGPDFFELDVFPRLKNLDEVPAKRRSQYRRRYEMLNAIEARITGTCAQSQLASMQ